jgi:hypothetical protein
MKIGLIVVENSARGRKNNHDMVFTGIKSTRAKFCHSECLASLCTKTTAILWKIVIAVSEASISFV